MSALKEAASIIRRRGRPTAFSSSFMSYISKGENKCHRSIVNSCYMSVAIGSIINSPNKQQYLWLVDETKVWNNTGKATKPEILTELGRVLHTYGERHFSEWCKIICEERPLTKDAVAIIRKWRKNNERMHTAPDSIGNGASI
jgi:hypothetical protein